MLLDKSRREVSQRYSPNSENSNSLQAVLIGEIMDEFKSDEEINPFHLLRLVYRLDQLPIKNKLNIKHLIKATMPANWILRKRFRNSDRNQSVKLILQDQAKLYETLKDQGEKQFFKIAWWVYFHCDTDYSKLYFDLYKKGKMMNSLIKSRPRDKEFFEMIQTASHFDKHGFRVLYDSRRYKHNKTISMKSHYTYLRGNRYKKFVSELNSMPLRYRCIVLNNMMNSKVTARVISRYSKLRKLVIDVYEQALKEDSDLAYSDDVRSIQRLSSMPNVNFDEDDKKRLSKLAKHSLERQIKYMKAGNVIHENQFCNNCAILGLTEQGRQNLLAIYKSNAQYFKHVLPMAKLFQLFLKYGFIEEILKILPNLKRGNYRPFNNENSRFSDYYDADEDTLKHVKRLLALYKTNREKALVLSVLGLREQVSFRNNYTKNEESIRTLLAKHANAAFKEGDVKHLDYAFYSYNGVEAIKAAGLMGDFIKSEKMDVENHFNDRENDHAIKVRVKFRMYLSYLYSAGKNSEILTITNKLNKLIEQNSMIRSTRGPIVRRRLEAFYEYVLNTGYNYMYNLYAEGPENIGSATKLKQLLPLIRKLNESSMILGENYRFMKSKNYRNSDYWYPLMYHGRMMKIIHKDLGEIDAYKEWRNSLKENMKKNLKQKNSSAINYYLTELSYTTEDRKIQRRHLLLFKRLFNSKEYQEQIVSNDSMTDHLAVALDSSVITPQQVISLYEIVKINYKVPSFEAAKYGDLAHAYRLLGDEVKSQDMLGKMNTILKKHPLKNKKNLAKDYFYQMGYYKIRGKKNEALGIMPEELASYLSKQDKKRYEENMTELKRDE